ncbi:hypothetical protein [Enterococcus sp. LJL90]
MTEEKRIFVVKRGSHCSVRTSQFHNDFIDPNDQFFHMNWNWFNGKNPLYQVADVENATHLKFEGDTLLYPVQHYFRWKGVNLVLENIDDFVRNYHHKRFQENKKQDKRKFYIN